jgi:DNA polymerase-3 subunit beta
MQPVSLTLEASQFAAVALFRARKDVRFYLTGVCVHTDKSGAYIVGCDGHTLAVHKIDDEPREDRQIIIPDDTVSAVAKISKGQITIDCGQQPGAYDGQIRRTCQIRTALATYAFNELDGKYPDWIRVAKHTQSPDPVFFNPEYLMRVHKAAELARGGKQKYPVLVSPGGTGCGFAQLDHKGMTCAWVMPMRTELSELPTHPGFSLSN